MAAQGVEVCHDAHLENATRWDSQGEERNNSTASRSQTNRSNMVGLRGNSRIRDFMRQSNAGSAAAGNGNNGGDDNTTVSRFSDDTGGQTAETTYSERMRAKRQFGKRLMIAWVSVAGTVFLGVVLWKNGLIFHSNDASVSAIQGASSTSGFDDEGNMLCNGLALNCHRRANEIMYATVHNAMSSRDDNFLAFNNLLPLESALAAGFRGLTLDSCDCERIGIQLCHGVCIAGFRRPIATFTAIVDFLKEHEHEVVVVEIEAGDNSLGPLFDVLQEVPGLLDLMYQHPGADTKWPKLKDMVEMDQRLIVFAHNDIGCEEEGKCPLGVHSTFDFAFETPFNQRGATQLMNVDESCSVSRGWSNSDWVISNHFATNDQGKLCWGWLYIIVR